MLRAKIYMHVVCLLLKNEENWFKELAVQVLQSNIQQFFHNTKFNVSFNQVLTLCSEGCLDITQTILFGLNILLGVT